MTQSPPGASTQFDEHGRCAGCGREVRADLGHSHAQGCPVDPAHHVPTTHDVYRREARGSQGSAPGFSASPLPPAGWYPDPWGGPQLRYWGGVSWTEHTSPYGAAPPPSSHGWPVAVASRQDADTQFVRRITEYTRWSGVGWIVLGLIQVVTVVAVIAGLWNL